MKKNFLIMSVTILLAAGCNKVTQNNQNNQPAQNQQSSSTQSDQTANWDSYASPAKYGFSIKYPADFGFNTDYNKIKTLGYIPVCDELTVACVFYTGNAYKGTNFEDAGVSVNINKNLNTEAKCYNFKVSTNEAQTPVADVDINGVTFKSATGGDAAAGHFMKTQEYRNFHNGQCYEIAQRVGSTNIGNYTPGTIKEFDQSQVWQKLQEVVNTFRLVN